MKEILDDLDRWRSDGRSVVLARVVDLAGSGPRDPGAAMAVNDRGEVAGSVSGGCIEGAVVTEALDVMVTGARRVVRFTYSDDDAVAVGLTCGGTVELFLEPLDWYAGAVADDPYPVLAELLRANRPVVLATVVDGDRVGAKLLARPAEDTLGTLGDADLDRVVTRDALGELDAGRSGVRRYGPQGQAGQDVVAVFVESFAPPPRLLVFGAVDFTAALARLGKVLGFHVTVCDAREVFATERRFPMADEVIVDWPHRLLERIGTDLGPNDAVCVLTHDVKFDVPALIAAFATDVGYIGAMGSRRTHAERVERLRAEGVDQADLDRIMAPIGLDLGGRTPEETALSIIAEIIAGRTGRRVPSLRDGDGPIHA